MFIRAKSESLFPILASAVHGMPLNRGMAQQAREAWCTCGGGVWPRPRPSCCFSYLCNTRVRKTLCCCGTKVTCITMCSDVCSSLAPTYIAGGEDIITMCSDMCYQSLSVLAERPGNQVGPHGASVMNPSSFGE